MNNFTRSILLYSYDIGKRTAEILFKVFVFYSLWNSIGIRHGLKPIDFAEATGIALMLSAGSSLTQSFVNRSEER